MAVEQPIVPSSEGSAPQAGDQDAEMSRTLPSEVRSAACVHEPDHMGAWSESGDLVWLPRSLYPKRAGAIAWAVEQWGCLWTDVRCTVGWLKYEPPHPEGYGEDWWVEVQDGHVEGAFKVWRLEAA